MTILARHWAILELTVLALLAPFALFPTPTRFAALLAIPALWCTRWYLTRRAARFTQRALRTHHVSRFTPHLIPRTPFDVAILGIALLVLVSLYATFDIAFSLSKIAGIVYGIAVFYATVDVASRSRRAFAWTVGFYLSLGLGLSGLAVIGTRWPAKFPFLSPLLDRLPVAIRGLPGAESGFHSNEVAGALLWFIPLALTVFVAATAPLLLRRSAHERESSRMDVNVGQVANLSYWLLLLGSGLGLLGMTATLVLTQSRGGLLGLAVGLIGMVAWLGWWGWGASLVAVGAAVGALLHIGPARVGDILFGGGESIEAVGTINLAGRVELWSRAIYGIQDFPFTGMGLNAFRRVVHVLYPLFLVSPDRDIGHAHNHLLQAALDLGLPGLIAYLALWILATMLLVQAWRTSRERWLRAIALGIFGSLLAYFVYGIADAVALGAKPGVAFWMLLALAVAVWQLADKPGSTQGRNGG